MPIIHITLVKGRDKEKVKNCIRQVAATVSSTLDAPLRSIRIAVPRG